MLLSKSLLVAYLINQSDAKCCSITNKSRSGVECQWWDRNHPHRVRYQPDATNHNSCAVADPSDPKPWCYLNDPNKRWEYCDCDVDCRNGEPVSHGHCTSTKTGRTCQKWSENHPHRPKLRPDDMNNNFCANPDNDPKGNWCYTTDPRKRWEYCDESCGDNSQKPGFGSTGVEPERPTMECGVTMRPFVRGRGQKHYSSFTETGQCQPPSCTQCELHQNYSQNKQRREADDEVPSEIGNKIYGGSTIKRGQAPWQVTLRGPSLCGGTLIKMNTIVSAAHCLTNDNPKDWRIQAGHEVRYERESSTMTGIIQMRQVTRIVKHELYNRGAKFNNDIALMIVDKDFDYTDYVRPACLPSPSFEFDQGHMIISGLGNTENGWVKPMKYATIPMCNQDACKRKFRHMFKSDNMICGGQTGKDSCQGDSGGPLIANVDDKFTLVGVTSWGIGCGLKDYPGIYTKVASYLEWINENS